MSFLKNVFQTLTDKRTITEPEFYKELNEESSLIPQLTSLSESKDPTIDQKKVESHLKLFSIGIAGEKNVRYELQHSMLPLVILHDVFLEYKDYSAQLDFVIITHKFVLVLEVKRLFGNIHITDQGEFQRIITKNNRVISKEGMYSPINQVERHVAILEKLLKEQGTIKNCPIHYAVTFANPKTILTVSKEAPEGIRSSVIRHDQIKTFLTNELEKKSPVMMTDQHLYEIADVILKFRKEKTLNLEDYQLNETLVTKTTNTPVKTKKENSNNLKKSLIDYRAKRSKELNRRAYNIFTNKVLDSLLEKRPLTMEQLVMIEGIGKKTAEEFGKNILAIIQSDAKEKKPSLTTQKQGDTITLQAALENFRTTRSKELNVKAYYIFTNTTLKSIVINKPETIDELLKIEGIGQTKADEFGEDIINIVKSN